MGNFENKLRNAINRPLVGDCSFSGEELKKLYSFIGKKIKEYNVPYASPISNNYDELFYIAIVNIAKAWNSSEEGFLDFIFSNLIGEKCNNKLYGYFTRVITRLAEKNKILFLESSKKQFYSTVLAHAYAPLSSTYAFFDLCLKIYNEDLLQNYNEEDEYFLYAAKQLKEKFDYEPSEDQLFTLGHDTYELRAGIIGIARENELIMAELIRKTICRINAIYESEDIPDERSYFDELIKDWWGKTENASEQVKNSKKSRQKVVVDYKNIRPKYLYDAGKILLCIPPIRLRNNIDTEPYITIRLGNSLVFHEELRTRGSGLVMTTLEKNYDVSLWVNDKKSFNFDIEIEHCGSIIYESKLSLNRSFMLLKDGQEVLNNTLQPGNYILATADFDNFSEYPHDIRKKSAHIYLLQANEGDIIQSPAKTVLFSNEKKILDIWPILGKRNDIRYIENDIEYDVIDGSFQITVKDGVDPSEYAIRLEDKEYSLSDFRFTKTTGFRYYFISDIVPEGRSQKMYIFLKENRKVLIRKNFINFRNLSVKYDRPIYYGCSYFPNEAHGVLSFITDNYYEEVPFDIDNDEVMLPMGKGFLHFTPPILKWKINNEKWYKCEDTAGIRYETLSNSAEILFMLPPSIEFQLILTNNSYVEASETAANSFKLGQTIYSIANTTLCDSLGVIVKLGEDIGFRPITTIYTRPQFLKDPFQLLNHTVLEWNPNGHYIGEEDAKFELAIYNEKELLRTENLDLNPRKIDVSDFTNGKYRIEISLIGKGFLKRRILLCKYERTFGQTNHEDFSGKEIYIHKAHCKSKYQTQEISPFYLSDLQFLFGDDATNTYSGEIKFVYNLSGPKGKQRTEELENTINRVRMDIRKDGTAILYGKIYDLESGAYKYRLGKTKEGFISIASADTTEVESFDYEVREIK